MKRMNDFNISAAIFKAIAVKAMILGLGAMLSCQLDLEPHVQVVLSPNHPPIFMVSEDEDFESPADVTRLSVFRRVNPPTYETYWTLDVGYRRWPAPGRRNEAVRISSITYGVVPEGFEEETAARPLAPGVEYCVEVFAGLIEPTVECFIYQP